MKKLLAAFAFLFLTPPAFSQPSPPVGIVIGAPVIGTCTTGYNVYNNSGVVGCQANATGGITALTGDVTASGSGSVSASLAWISRTGSQALGIGAGGTLGSNAFNSTAIPANANPSAPIGLSAVNGTATTFMTSDSAPALSQSIVPTWTGLHTFSPAAAASPTALTWSGPLALGTNNAAGAWTFKAPMSTGSATNPDLIFQTGVKTGSGTGAATPTTALTIKGENQELQVAGNLSWGGDTFLSRQGANVLQIGKLSGAASGYLFAAGAYLSNSIDLSYFGGGINLSSSSTYGWAAAGVTPGTKDLILSRAAAASLQLGAANAAAPVAQTLQTQGSRSGTDTDVGGANLTIGSGLGTSAGALSALILQSPGALLSTGKVAQTATTGLTIKGGQAVSTGYTVSTLPAGIAGGRVHVTDQLTTCAAIGVALTGGGALTCPAFYNGSAWVGG